MLWNIKGMRLRLLLASTMLKNDTDADLIVPLAGWWIELDLHI